MLLLCVNISKEITQNTLLDTYFVFLSQQVGPQLRMLGGRPLIQHEAMKMKQQYLHL